MPGDQTIVVLTQAKTIIRSDTNGLCEKESMILKGLKKSAKQIGLRPKRKKKDDACGGRKSKELKYDTGVPGDRGDCEKTSLVQGSE